MRKHTSREFNEPFTVNGRIYTKKYAKMPRLSTSRKPIWLCEYYTCERRGEVIVLTYKEWLEGISH